MSTEPTEKNVCTMKLQPSNSTMPFYWRAHARSPSVQVELQGT